jgi:hypothetical protein
MIPCDICKNEPVFGSPSAARWKGPDGKSYCSMHFVSRFGHAEPLVKIEGFEPPEEKPKPKPKTPKKPKAKAPKEVEA